MIYIVLDGVPPSDNQAYFNNPAGGRTLTKAGTRYKKDVIQHIIKHHANETRQLRKDVALGCLIAYGFPEMFNKGWPDKAKTKFKRIDVSNRDKLLHDAIVEATTVDDSQIAFDYKYKYLAEKPLTTIYIWNEDDEPIGQRLLAAFDAIVRGSLQV